MSSSSNESKKRFYHEVDGLIYRTAIADDAEEVWQLLATQFYPRSAICLCLEMNFPADIEAARALVPAIIAEGVSLVVEVAATKELIGARLSSIELAEQTSEKHPWVSDSGVATEYPKYSVIYRMFDELTASVDCFQRYSVTRVLSFKFLVVAESHGRRGIAKKLVEFSLEVAKDFGLELAVVFTGSRYSERIYDSLGFDKLHVFHLPDFVDPVTGSKPFARLNAEVLENSVLYAKRV